ncbi:MAG: hypothetical protein IJ744_04545 [Lachnospiraceae bacterium]|nr:hypothetical protein [Lachnospiraceae bacterium]
MKNLNDVIERVYQSYRFSLKGFSSDIKDVFLFQSLRGVKIVFLIEESELTGDNSYCYYLTYSVQKDHIVDTEDEEYLETVQGLPSLNEVTYRGGKFNHRERRRLRTERDELFASFLLGEAYSHEEKSRYLKYLEDAKALKSPSVQKVYDFFIDHAKNL